MKVFEEFEDEEDFRSDNFSADDSDDDDIDDDELYEDEDEGRKEKKKVLEGKKTSAEKDENKGKRSKKAWIIGGSIIGGLLVICGISAFYQSFLY